MALSQLEQGGYRSHQRLVCNPIQPIGLQELCSLRPPASHHALKYQYKETGIRTKFWVFLSEDKVFTLFWYALNSGDWAYFRQTASPPIVWLCGPPCKTNSWHPNLLNKSNYDSYVMQDRDIQQGGKKVNSRNSNTSPVSQERLHY